MIQDWLLPKLDALKRKARILVRDPQRLASGGDPTLREFCERNEFVLLTASTNLVFRQEYDWALEAGADKKILLIDQSRSHSHAKTMHAPAPFYPDLLAEIEPDARLEIDLRDYLKFRTGDPSWPALVNERQYADLIADHLPEVIRAHARLRTADPTRFTDADLRQIVAYAALGIAESAFRTPTAEDYLKIGLFGLDQLETLNRTLPEVMRPIREALKMAPAPFRWFGTRPTEEVVRTFYLCVLLAQHSSNWQLLVGNIDRSIGAVSEIQEKEIRDGAARLVEMNPNAADRDLMQLEESLTSQDLELFLVQQACIGLPEGWASLLERERYSTLVRSLALLVALGDRLSADPHAAEHARVEKVLAEGPSPGKRSFVEQRRSPAWTALRDIYLLAGKIQPILQDLTGGLRSLRTTATFADFWRLWNERKINRLEYYLSRLERAIGSAELLPIPEDRLPAIFTEAVRRLRDRARVWREEADGDLKALNLRFQDLVSREYPNWITHDADPRLTAQFVRRCLKPNWDPQTEKAVLFIFDGMRYDIWDEMLRPILEDRMEVLHDYPAASILPSETQLTRKAISAGDYPDRFNRNAAESDLLKAALECELGLNVTVVTKSPETAGTGETVRYQAGNLDVYIFELCDKELHGIAWKQLPDGRHVPGRPLAFIYEQQIKNVLDTEVQAIVRRLQPGTKVFITADHGFGPMGRNPIWFQTYDLNDQSDIKYLNGMLIPEFNNIDLPPQLRKNLVGFRPADLRMPVKETVTPRNEPPYEKNYGSIVFPRVGYALKRSSAPFNPDAYSHGGISLPELLIPMVVLRVKDRDAGLLIVAQLEGPTVMLEGEEVVFQIKVRRAPVASSSGSGAKGLRLDAAASYMLASAPQAASDSVELTPQVRYAGVAEEMLEFRFVPDVGLLSSEDRGKEKMDATFTVTLRWQEGGREVAKSRAARFELQLKPEVITRRVGSLGSVLGLTPRSRQQHTA